MQDEEKVIEQKMKFATFEPALGEWGEKLRPFIEGKEMWDMYQKIKADAQVDKIVPSSKDTYRALKTTRPGDLKVIFYLQDPYPRLYKNGDSQATGIAMDCRNTPDGKTLQPSLNLWYDAIDETLKQEWEKGDKLVPFQKVNRSPNLDYLHEQGVMLLNTDLTCRVNKTSSHAGLWEPFQKYFLEEVLSTHTGLIYVLCGKQSQKLEKYINPLGNYIFHTEHPAAASHRNDSWRYDNIFSIVNQIITENNGPQYKILWNKDDWDIYKDPPF